MSCSVDHQTLYTRPDFRRILHSNVPQELRDSHLDDTLLLDIAFGHILFHQNGIHMIDTVQVSTFHCSVGWKINFTNYSINFGHRLFNIPDRLRLYMRKWKQRFQYPLGDNKDSIRLVSFFGIRMHILVQDMLFFDKLTIHCGMCMWNICRGRPWLRFLMEKILHSSNSRLKFRSLTMQFSIKTNN